jgi:hypothetical protein
LITQLEMTTSTVLSGRGMLSMAFQEFDVLRAGLALVFVGQREHFVGHVEAVGFAGWPHAPGGEQHVDAAARAQIKHSFAGAQLREGRWVPASERGQHRLFGNLLGLRLVVEIRGDRIAGKSAGRRHSAATAAATFNS